METGRRLGYSEAHFQLGIGNSKKEKFHCEVAAMAGHEEARCNLGTTEAHSGNTERAIKHWMIAASAGDCRAMQAMRDFFERGFVSRESIYSTLTAYNNSCADMRSEARDAYIRKLMQSFNQ